MQVSPQQLDKHIADGILANYLISGDEPLLVQETQDKLRAAARAAGCSERECFTVDGKFDWAQLADATQALSLFGDRKIIELRFATKPDKAGREALEHYAANAGDDNILIVTCDALDKRSLEAKWVKSLTANGALIRLWPVGRGELPAWIGKRLQSVGLTADQDAVELLADRVEGNLLAAAQEIDKLRIVLDESGDGPTRLDSETVMRAVSDSARFDVFGLIDTALGGDTLKCLRKLDSLRAEGAEEIPLLALISRELRGLHQCASLVARGQPVSRALTQARVWDKRKPLYERALKRLNAQKISKLLLDAAATDRAQKGLDDADAGAMLTKLLVEICTGRRLYTT